jgi:putative lipoic acid-binding regulatory protein
MDGGNGKGNGGAGADHDPFDLLEFPCRFEIKAMGRHSSRFDALVHNIVSRHIAGDDLLHSQRRPSRHGKYVSVTCIIRASSKGQIRAIYAELAECPDVLMTL